MLIKPPKEKAKELVERFLFMPIGHCLMTTENAKQCALICCDEIINSLILYEEKCVLSPVNAYFLPETETNYWNKVKEEIKSVNKL